MDELSTDRLRHDAAVLRHAMSLIAEGFTVQARLEGLFERPQCVIYGYRPDVVGVLHGQTVIVEVIKGEVDWPKRAAFTRYASEHADVKLELVDA